MTLPLNQDITIGYAGASGGFYFLHQLLLTGHHWARFLLPDQQLQARVAALNSAQRSRLRATQDTFRYYRQPGWPGYLDYFSAETDPFPEMSLEEPVNLDDIDGQWPQTLDWVIDYQWNISSGRRWKRSEVWVDSISPGEEYQFYQILPQQYHRARIVCCNSPTEFSEFWHPLPGFKILLYTDFETQLIMAEYKCAGRMPNMSEVNRSQVTAIYQSRPVFNILKNQFSAADSVIYLQDFVNDQTQFLGPMNPAQQALRQRWLDLHPPKLLEQVGIHR